MLNATWLETFTVLAELGHFTRTAEALNMTQPGVSQQLRKLEAQIGQPLIAQDGKSFALTPAGEAVLRLGRARRGEEQRLREEIARDDPDSGSVAIACSGSFAMLFYPQAVALMAAAPGLSIRLEAAPQAAVLAGVLDNRFDLGVLGHDPGHPRLQARALGQEELCLVVPADTPLDTSGQALRFDDLEARGFVAHPDGFAYANDLFTRNFPEDFTGADRLRIRSYVNQIGQIPAPVAAGLGYTLLPRSGVDAYPGRDRLRIVPLPHRVHHDLWLIRRRGRPMSARLHRLSGLLEQVAAGLF